MIRRAQLSTCSAAVAPVDSLVRRVADPGPGPPAVYDELVLEQNFPNPCNPATTIRFSVPADGRVSLRIYDVRGRHVRTLLDERRGSGTHLAVWDGRNNEGELTPAGVYSYLLTTRVAKAGKKLVVVR